jgi:hypothetical protein
MLWRTELVNVEKFLDELWIGVKGQSNLVISCSLRNNFRVSLGIGALGVEHWIHAGDYRPTKGNQTPNTRVQAGR